MTSVGDHGAIATAGLHKKVARVGKCRACEWKGEHGKRREEKSVCYL
jgi:hypothetical protein